MKEAFLRSIRFYQRRISPLFPARCRYYPTCSAYMVTAVERFGLLRGGLMGVLRLMRCNILFPGGFDPVPELGEKLREKKSSKGTSNK